MFRLRFRLVCMPVCDKLWNIFLVNRGPLRLPRVFGQRVRDAKPPEAVYDILFELELVALIVGVLKTQEHHSLVMRRKQVIKKGGPYRPYVQKPRRRGRKPGNNLFHTLLLLVGEGYVEEGRGYQCGGIGAGKGARGGGGPRGV